MKYVFGPVPSRRLGQSLGIDPIPLKTCNWNCVYCQLGRTIPLSNERREFFPAEDILAEVQSALGNHSQGEIDWVTLVGSGETTLYSRLGWLIQEVKAITDLPIAVITNGALLVLPEVRQDLLRADAVMPTLDAGTADLYRQINRPHPGATLARLVEGLIAFRKEYTGHLWVEVMLVRGLNDSRPALQDIAAILRQIAPDEVHINLPTRPPVETWVEPPDEPAIQMAVALLGNIARVIRPVQGTFDLNSDEDITNAILNIITRHPMRQAELEQALLVWDPTKLDEALIGLKASGRAQMIERGGARFWSAAHSYYPNENQSYKTAPPSWQTGHPNPVEKITFQPIGYIYNPFDAPAPPDVIKGAESQLVIKPEFELGLDGLEAGQRILVLFCFHLSDSYELHQHPRNDPSRPKRGVFALRSPRRPNPIGATEVEIITREGNRLRVRGLDALNGTPVLDIKPLQ